jgi:crotonobetainyl-CoA:carnitine CoA-transferase CaiB-like acyl-CoA transferase
MGLPLEGLRVTGFTQDFAGPFCTMILSDLCWEVFLEKLAESLMLKRRQLTFHENFCDQFSPHLMD